MTSKADVNNFLRDLKRIASRKGVNLIKRDKNELAKQGLTMLDFQNEIMSLNYKDYSTGPEPDKDLQGDVWVFGKAVGSEQYYIKLKVSSNKNSAICLSFHPADRPLSYPL